MTTALNFYKKYDIDLDGHSYSIQIGRGILTPRIIEALEQKTKNKNLALVYDKFFEGKIGTILKDQLVRSGYVVYLHPLNAGKNYKTISQAMNIYELLESNDMSRDSTIIALGGGVIGDLAGFVASTYFRGINLIHVPTTLTAMIDSSIGGKVAINFRKTINAIGNYYHPLLNIIDLQFLDTLPMRDIRAGISEIIKCSIIDDKNLFDYLISNAERIVSREQEYLTHIMCRAIEVKVKHVMGDVKEDNKRLKLNYGHTIGHAIEVSTDVVGETYKHGEGVSLGMVGSAVMAKEYLSLDGRVVKMHEEILKRYGLPIQVYAEKIGWDRDLLIKECMLNIYKDKKRKDNKLRFILPQEIGECKVYSDIPDDLIRGVLNYIIRG